MRLSRTGSRRPLVLHVSPAGESDGEAGQAHIGALVPALDLAWRCDIDPERVAELLGPTRAASRIAVLLAQGESIDEVAAETGLRRTTVKWHIRHVYAKNGLSWQAEPMQLVSSLADDVPKARDQDRRRPRYGSDARSAAILREFPLDFPSNPSRRRARKRTQSGCMVADAPSVVPERRQGVHA